MTNELNTTNTHGRNQKGSFEDIFGDLPANEPAYVKPEYLHSTRLDEDGSVIAPVLDAYEKVHFHYIDTPELKGYIQCNGDGCVLCEANMKADQRLLMAIYNLLSERMEVLAIPPAVKPTSLLPQLKPLLNKGGHLISITKNGYQYEVTSNEIPNGVVIDQNKVLSFKNAYENNEFSLADIYQIKSNEELECIPQIEKRLMLKRGRAA
ncbi:hypothetical protein [Vibrio parahaemolyticus]|uniref:hypothetical protein n=1 Tax=Vibrio parahaemolyticus TaxID=670 RepID=UPI000471903D|nr:hypothetical protein [Vibrio parahaemolyticus]MDF5409658.1 hypothetical protein [Vibrio parahaemolyticus]MDG2657446.1 hypothetical protein [Vibrio parahaemolyticus]MDG2825156.1 hypothetical protein [Vibrio parahaemolyticus]MDG2844853.1 hypothetical protein [Vibrio parahaemolyticus]MDG2860858.1 hypothetical protein [Vibrio parahaemolyticus]